MRSYILLLMLSLVCIGIGFGRAVAADQRRTEMTVDFIAAGVEYHLDQILSGTAKVTVHQSRSDWWRKAWEATSGHAFLPEEVETGVWFWKSPNLYVARLDPLIMPDRTEMTRNVFVTNGEHYYRWTYYQQENKLLSGYSLGDFGWASDQVTHGIPRTEFWLDPRYWGYCFGQKPLSTVLKDPESKARIVGTKEYYGTECIGVETQNLDKSHDVFWLDPGHGYLVRRHELFLTAVGKAGSKEFLRSVVEVPKISGQGDTWLPARVQSQTIGVKPDGTQAVESTIAVDIEDVSLGSTLPDSLFDFGFPPGTLVTNHITSRAEIVQWVPAENAHPQLELGTGGNQNGAPPAPHATSGAGQ